MYRVIVTSKGMYGNTMLGARYCFHKKTAAHLIATFTKSGCEFVVERLLRIRGDIFCWSSNDISDKIWNMVDTMLDESKQE